MIKRPPPDRWLWLQRVRLLRAQRHWRGLKDTQEALLQEVCELEKQCQAEWLARDRCLARADAATTQYALLLRRAIAHGRDAQATANEASAVSRQLAELAPALQEARRRLEKTRRVLEETPLP